MSMPLTILDLMDFILLNRGTTTFIDQEEGQIAYNIRKGLAEKSLFYNVNNDGKIDGMILADIDAERKLIFVTENIAMNLKNLGIFAKKAKETWPGYRIEAFRHKTLRRKYNTEKLYNKLICQ